MKWCVCRGELMKWCVCRGELMKWCVCRGELMKWCVCVWRRTDEVVCVCRGELMKWCEEMRLAVRECLKRREFTNIYTYVTHFRYTLSLRGGVISCNSGSSPSHGHPGACQVKISGGCIASNPRCVHTLGYLGGNSSSMSLIDGEVRAEYRNGDMCHHAAVARKTVSRKLYCTALQSLFVHPSIPLCLPSLSFCLSFHPSLFVCLSIPLCLSVCLSIPLCLSVSVCPSISLFVSVSPSLFVCLSLFVPPSLSVCLSLPPFLSVCLSLHPSLSFSCLSVPISQ